VCNDWYDNTYLADVMTVPAFAAVFVLKALAGMGRMV
jgi:hypothetical protein